MSSTGLHSVPNRQPVLPQQPEERRPYGFPAWFGIDMLEQRRLLDIFLALMKSGNHIANPP